MKPLIVGDKSILAIESQITKPYKERGQLALGFFVIYVAGNLYGVRAPAATLLACSFDEVAKRIDQRGGHRLPIDPQFAAVKMADAYLDATYEDIPQSHSFFGMSVESFRNELVSKDIAWAPDGDEAFDDGGHVLQFDFGDKVRVVAFRNEAVREDSRRSVSDVWIDSSSFYELLEKWRDAFERQQAQALKIKSKH